MKVQVPHHALVVAAYEALRTAKEIAPVLEAVAAAHDHDPMGDLKHHVNVWIWEGVGIWERPPRRRA